MTKKQQRIKQRDLESTQALWLGQSLSVVFLNGAVLELRPQALQSGVLLGHDALGLKHKSTLKEIKEIILNIPVADEHAQTSAD